MQKSFKPLLTKKEVVKFQQTILNWYKKNKRDLPWRHPSITLGDGLRDPYKILVSEVMAQQTQLTRVIPKYEAWMQAFPTIEDLAKASTRDVLHYWSGLGYNRRALYLKKCAEELAKKTKWPETEKELRQLPGIGEYTARALLCFAFNHQVAVVDTNVRKVILVHFKNVIPVNNVIPDLIRNPEIKCGNDKEKEVIDQIAWELLPRGHAYDWNQALMDYAAAELKAHKIPIPKQSKFIDSDRYFRGQTIKLLLTKNNQSFASLWKNIRKVKEIGKDRYANVIAQLEKDKLITKKGSTFTLPD